MTIKEIERVPLMEMIDSIVIDVAVVEIFSYILLDYF